MPTKHFALALLMLLVLSPVIASLAATQAQAAALGATYLRFDRMKAATAPGTVRVVFTTSAEAQTEAKIKITLDSEWVSTTHFSATAANYTTAAAAGFTSPPTLSAAATVVSGQTITFTSGTLAASTQYGFDITGTGFILNPAASNTITHTVFTTTTGDAVIDTKDVSSPVISDDQVVITATVAPTFTFTLGNNAQSLGTLSTSAVSSGPGTAVTIVTNAPNGWNTGIKNAGAGLVSVNAAKTIANTGTIDGAPNTLSTGTEGYVMDVDLTTDAGGGGTVSVAAEYNGGTTSAGGTLSTTYQLAASSTGTANSDVVTLYTCVVRLNCLP